MRQTGRPSSSTSRLSSGRVAHELAHALTQLAVETRGRGLTDLTDELSGWLAAIGAGDGLATVFLRHTSASLLIQENADPDVGRDLLDALDRLAPAGAGYRHSLEGPDDMPAHIKAALLPVSLSIPVADGRPLLGTWQGVYVVEHRTRPHRREVVLSYVGSLAAGAV